MNERSEITQGSTEERAVTLQRTIRGAQKQLDKIETAERYAKAKKLVGACFRYRNCYSCPKSEKDYWWLYQRVTEVTKDGWLVMFTFETDSLGQNTITPANTRTVDSTLGERITPKQLQHAWRVMVRRVNATARSHGIVK